MVQYVSLLCRYFEIVQYYIMLTYIPATLDSVHLLGAKGELEPHAVTAHVSHIS